MNHTVTGAASRPSVALLIAVSSLGTILAPLNSTMIAVALPEIRDDFSLSHGAVAWLVSAYLIAMAVAQPIGGRLGDTLGRVRVYRAGMLVFMALAIVTPFSPNFAVLVTLRIVQAVAGAVLIPNGAAILRTHAPPGQLGRLNGINGGIISFAAAVGPLIGAGVLAFGSWRLMFPLSVPGILVALYLLRRLDDPQERTESRPFDATGALLFVAAFVALTVQLSTLRGDAGAARSVAGWAIAAAIIAAFAWRQRTTASPAAEWRLFRQRSFAAATAYSLLTNLTMYTTLLMIPFFVREVLGKSTELSGLLLGAMSVLVAVMSPFGGRLSDTWGRRPSAQLGGVLILAAAIALAVGLRSDTSPAFLAGVLALMGLGIGIGVGAANTAAIESAPRALAGTAAGTSSMMRYTGSIIGAGILAGVLNSDSAGGDPATFRLVAIAVVMTAALALAASSLIHRFGDADAPIPVSGAPVGAGQS